MKQNISVGDKVVSDLFKLERGFPSIIKVKKIDEEFGLIFYEYKGREHFIGFQSIRPATKFEKFFGPIYDFIIK